MICTTLPAFTPSRNGSCSFRTFAEICPLAFPSCSTANGSPFFVTLSSRLRHPHDLAFLVDAHQRLQAADAARLLRDPRLVQLRAIRLRRRFHREFHVRVFTAAFAWVRPGDSLRALTRDLIHRLLQLAGWADAGE